MKPTLLPKVRRSSDRSLCGWAALLAVAGLILTAAPATAFEESSALSVPAQMAPALSVANSTFESPDPALENASATIYDTDAPSAGTLTAPAYTNGPVTLSYSDVADTGGSGLTSVSLWVKVGAQGTWTNTGQSLTTASGSFEFSAFSGEGEYFFALQAQDAAENLSSEPVDAGMAKVVYDVTPPTLTLVGSASVAQPMGRAYVDAGATATDSVDGNITANIVAQGTVNILTAGAYTISYSVSDRAGNAAAALKRTVTITPAYILTLTQPAKGTLSANPLPNAEGRYGGGTAVTLTYTPPVGGGYEVLSWTGATQSPTNALQSTVTVIRDTTVGINVARETGTVEVSVTPTSALWTLTDGDHVTHTGSGTQTVTGVPTGAVSIAFSALSGYTTPASQQNTLAKGATVRFTATYQKQATAGYTLTLTQPAEGALTASPAPGADGKYAAGAVVTVAYVPLTNGKYELASWSGVTAPTVNSPSVQVTMNVNTTVAVALRRQTGDVNVAVSPSTATWSVKDGDGATHTGSGVKTLSAIPTGSISITYNAVQGYATPNVQTETLLRGGTVNFSATYQPQAGTVVLSLSPGLSGAPGDTLAVPLYVSEAKGITNFRATLGFDATKLEYLGLTKGTLVSGWTTPTGTASSGSVTVAASGAALTTGSGSLAVVRLRVRAGALSGNTPLTLSNAALNGGKLACVVQDGSAVISGATGFTWGDVDNDQKATTQDATQVLQFAAGLMTQFTGNAAAANVTGETPAVVGAYDAALVLKKEAGTLAKFPADGNGDGLGPDATAQLLTAADASQTRKVTVAGTLTVQPGAELRVPITISTADDVLAYRAEVKYDPNTLEFLGVTPGDRAVNWVQPVVKSGSNTVLVLDAGAASGTGAGSLVVLIFRGRSTVVAGQTTSLQLTSVQLNDGLIPAQIVMEGSTAPTLASIAPNQGSATGQTLVTLYGANLQGATEVTFGASKSPWVRVRKDGASLLAVAPQGTGTVDVSVSSPEGSATLKGAFTYFAPDIHLSLKTKTSANVGDVFEVPVYMTTTGSAAPSTVSFKLRFDPATFGVVATKAEPVTLGSAAVGATLSTNMSQPGELTVTITKSKGTLSNGLLCTCRLMVIGGDTGSEGLIYLGEVTARTATAKSLGAAAAPPALPAE